MSRVDSVKTSAADSFQDHVRRVLGRDVLGHPEPEHRQIDAIEQRLAATEHHRCDREMQLIDETGDEVLAHGRDAATDLDVAITRGSPGPVERDARSRR